MKTEEPENSKCGQVTLISAPTGDINDGNSEIKIGLALLSKMRRQNKNTDTTMHGIRGFSLVLPEVQIYLRDSFQEREN